MQNNMHRLVYILLSSLYNLKTVLYQHLQNYLILKNYLAQNTDLPQFNVSLINEHLGVTTLLSIVPFKTRQVGNLPKEFDWRRVEGDAHFTF